MNKLLIVLSAAFIAACGGGSYSHFEKGQNLVLDGLVDNVSRQDLAHEKKLYSLTSVGYVNGQGVTLLGLQPGISKGKHIHITAEFMVNINGTDIFKVKSIQARVPVVEAVIRPAPAPKPFEPVPLDATDKTRIDHPSTYAVVEDETGPDKKQALPH